MNKWKWISKFLVDNNLTRKDLALALNNWPLTRVSELVNGKRDLPKSKLLAASKFFSIDLEVLVKYNDGIIEEIKFNNTSRPDNCLEDEKLNTIKKEDDSEFIEYLVYKASKFVEKENLDYSHKEKAKLIKLLYEEFYPIYKKFSKTEEESKETTELDAKVINFMEYYEKFRKVI